MATVDERVQAQGVKGGERAVEPVRPPAKRSDFAELVASHGATLYARALWLTRDESAAADLLQDTFERAIRRGPRNVPTSSLLRWLMTVMTNRFRDDRRAEKVRRCVRDSDRVLQDLPAMEGQSCQLWRCVTDATVAGCVDRLPSWMKDMLQLHFAGAAYADLSAHFEIPVSTVGTRMLRIRQRLGKQLRQELKTQLPDDAVDWFGRW